MGLPTHFTNGVSNTSPGDELYYFGMLDPTQWNTYFNDFHTFATGDWVITTVEAGGGSASEALTDGNGGLLLITNDAADDDSDFFQLVKESFTWSSTKRMFFKARFKVSDATQSDVLMGLQVTDTTPLDAADGLFFLKSDGAATVDFKAVKTAAGTTTLSSVATMANDTFIELAFAYLPQANGGPIIQVFADGALVASTTTTTNIPTTDLTLSFGVQNGEAVAKTMTVDYLLVSVER